MLISQKYSGNDRLSLRIRAEALVEDELSRSSQRQRLWCLENLRQSGAVESDKMLEYKHQISRLAAGLTSLAREIVHYSQRNDAAGELSDLIANSNLSPEETRIDHAERRDQAFEKICRDHGRLLTALGLLIDPHDHGSWSSSVPDFQGEPFAVRIHLDDRKKFLNFLSQLTAEKVEEFGLAHSLLLILRAFESNIRTQYFLGPDISDQGLSLLGSLGDILASYEQLGLESLLLFREVHQTLSEYHAFAQEHCLRQYLEARKLYLLPPDARPIHDNTSSEMLTERWQKVIDLIEQVRTTSLRLAELLRTNLVREISDADEYYQRHIQKGYSRQSIKWAQGLIAVVDQMRSELRDLEERL